MVNGNDHFECTMQQGNYIKVNWCAVIQAVSQLLTLVIHAEATDYSDPGYKEVADCSDPGLSGWL